MVKKYYYSRLNCYRKRKCKKELSYREEDVGMTIQFKLAYLHF